MLPNGTAMITITFNADGNPHCEVVLKSPPEPSLTEDTPDVKIQIPNVDKLDILSFPKGQTPQPTDPFTTTDLPQTLKTLILTDTPIYDSFKSISTLTTFTVKLEGRRHGDQHSDRN